MGDIPVKELADRVQALEDIVAIRNVQYDYWRSVDWTKEVQKILCLKRWGKPEEIG